jgi:hypothetical protein
MANTNAPNGFNQWYGGSGGVPTFALSTRRVASSNTTPIYSGDPVMPVIATATGYVTQAAPGTTRIDGIFDGCDYMSIAQKRKTWSNYWPGSDASGDVHCRIIDDPNAQFVVMGNGTTFNISGTLSAWGTSPIGLYAQFAIGTGTAFTGRSGAYLNAVGTTVTFPFIVRGLRDWPSSAPGADPTTAYNQVIVGFNNQWQRTNGAGPTGIA